MTTLSSVSEYRQLSVHLCGDSRAGKTTLRRSLYHCIRNNFGLLSLPATLKMPPNYLESTIGLEKELISKRYGINEYVLYDYGGQEEYHINHSSHLASGPGSVYVVVVALAVVDDNNIIRPRGNQDEQECALLVERYKFWLRFINSVAAPESLVYTLLNFQSVAAPAFSHAVLSDLVRYQQHAISNRQLRNLRFWKDVCVCDLVRIKDVYSSSFFHDIEKSVMRKSSTTLTCGMSAARRMASSLPKVLPLSQFKEDHLSRALLEISHVRDARTCLPLKEWESLSSFLLSETVNGLLSSGDILGINGYVVTDFNWLTRNVLGIIFRRGWLKAGSQPNHVTNFALSSHAIEHITGLRSNFEGDVDALPMLLEQLHVCKRFEMHSSETRYWFSAFRPLPRPREVLLMKDPVRIVRRRFYLNDDYIFPPGYFADLCIKITKLDSSSHEFSLWEDGMKFESRFIDNGQEYTIGVYIYVEPSSHFDLVVCSSNHVDRVVDGEAMC